MQDTPSMRGKSSRTTDLGTKRKNGENDDIACTKREERLTGLHGRKRDGSRRQKMEYFWIFVHDQTLWRGKEGSAKSTRRPTKTTRV
jgi:hypothetical protein